MAAKAKGQEGALQRWLKAAKSETRLLGKIDKHLISRPPDTSRRQDVLHPSELIKSDFCPRAAYYRLQGYTPEPERHGLRMQSIFDEGHAVHHRWQGWLAEMGVLYGMWSTSEGTVWATSSDIDVPTSHYREVPLKDPGLRIHGHSDGWVKGLGDDFLIEIKSIGPGTIRVEQPELFRSGDLTSAWKQISRPFPTHLRQGQLYLALVNRMAERGEIESAPQEIVFIYELKADQSSKEFVVSYSPEISKDALDTAYDVVRAVDKENPPECPNDKCSACAALEVSLVS